MPADAVKLFKQFTILGRIGPETAHELSAKLKLDATEAIKALESRGLVESVTYGAGTVAWQLTLACLSIGDDERYYDSIDRQLAAIFTDDEMISFSDCLSKIRKSFAKDP